MGAQLSVDPSVHVVIVGGGFAGIAAARQLKSQGVPFTLLDLKDAFHHNVGALRASVQSGFARKTFIPYIATFGESFKQGRVVRIDLETQTVVLEGGEELKFSHLILSTGSEGDFPGKFNEPVTMETAIQQYEDMVKEVTLIHSRVALADVELLPSVRQGVKEGLLQKGVQLLLSEKVSNLAELSINVTQKGMKVLTDKGSEVTADLVIRCTGIRVNSAAYSSVLGDRLAENGALRVNAHLQVEGLQNVYAIGDCAHLQEPKMAYHAGLHGAVAAENIINTLRNKPLRSYTPGCLNMLVTLGRDDGIGQINGYKVGSLVVRMAKSKDLFAGKSWKEMGQPIPQ
ncbi:apoptosis-inducing factor 2 isoform X2 [Acipenser ruthenus]|uniref:apoptosis-inducing factor 2 isoform X2 n=1 Tax=Acipenser ruthenus TaxID=7906 RepID=UPI002740AB66|nr:apoptosis-inducing factor 2 isoform X2 [Acipenser ruthenus]